MTKTLGDLKGLMPEKHQVYGNENVRTKARKENRNRLINQISALPLLDVVKKAVESGLIVVKPCDSCGSNGWYIGHRLECSLNREECCDCGGEQIQCEPCTGNGFTITEGNAELRSALEECIRVMIDNDEYGWSDDAIKQAEQALNSIKAGKDTK